MRVFQNPVAMLPVLTHALFPIRAELLSELSPKFRELTRTDSLPDVPHSVKEERQIVMRQEHPGEHLARQVKVADKST
jgi:hypothetical protein